MRPVPRAKFLGLYHGFMLRRMRRALQPLPFLLLAGSLLCAIAGARHGAPEEQTVMASEQPASTTQPASTVPPKNPDAVCATCHTAIYSSYEKTAMARGGGPAVDGLLPGSFEHRASGVEYRVFLRDGQAWMSYSRPSGSSARKPDEELSGERQLLDFIGSGHHGRTYLYRVNDQWFELPINDYTRRSAWDMAPAYDDATTMPVLPIEPDCLHCHSTSVATPLPEARNRFAGAPFAQAGVGCSACHGDPSAHLAQGGHGPIVNPDKLTAVRRDSACVQCHLEGNAVIYRPGRTLAQFLPGDDLSDFAVYFVHADQASGGRRASSQYEALLQSACKRASGDRLTCTTCHDPHSSPLPADRVAYFRARCLSCHNSPELAASHHPEQPNCATCHMPSRSTADISHEQLTDHNIQPHPLPPGEPSGSSPDLVPVGSARAGDREFGLAYAQFAQRGDRVAGERALKLLHRAEEAGAADEQVHVNLGFLEQVSGQPASAAAEYTTALALNPFEPAALADLAVIEASSGQTAQAITHLQRLFEADPSQTSAGLNLAFIECRMGRVEDARAITTRLQAVNPDAHALRTFLQTGAYGAQSCPAIALHDLR